MSKWVFLVCIAFLMIRCAAVTSTPTARHAMPSPIPRCHVRGVLPDPLCTPGAILPVTREQVCKAGYAKSVRNVPESEKLAVYKEYGILHHAPGAYEVDHLVSLELGGSNDISNLWPEAAKPKPGYHEKDAVENSLHQQVCSKVITLAQAQREIATNWLAVYKVGA